MLDAALKTGKAREVKLKEPGLAKSMQRFCNAVAAGLPALLRATQNDPPYYDKTLRVSQHFMPLVPLENASVSGLGRLCLGSSSFGPLERCMAREFLYWNDAVFQRLCCSSSAS